MLLSVDVIIIFTSICNITLYILGASHSMRRGPFACLQIEVIFGISVSVRVKLLRILRKGKTFLQSSATPNVQQELNTSSLPNKLARILYNSGREMIESLVLANSNMKRHIVK